MLGIIKAFADLSHNQASGAAAVMSGISEALVATAVGLMVAIPAVVAFNIFQGRVRRAMAEIDAHGAPGALRRSPRAPPHRRESSRVEFDVARANNFGSGDDEPGPMIVNINVTPLVDITLVLLIIFMVTASYIVSPAIHVDLPKAASGTEQQRTALGLTLTKEGALYLNGAPSDDEAVKRFIGGELPRNPDLQALIAADRAVPHGDVVHVIDLVQARRGPPVRHQRRRRSWTLRAVRRYALPRDLL